MELVHGFVASRPFDDEKHFPYGLSKSGIFSIPEVELLSSVGNRLLDLAQGIANADNQVEESFLKMCQGQREAETRVERLWQKYQKNIRRKTIITLNGNTSVPTDSQTADEDIA